MAYVQPDVDRYVLGGYSFFRMKQELASPGDIFESPQSAHAFALGPDSDISRVNVGYYDEQISQFLNQFTITPQRSFVNEIVAFNKTKSYAPSQVPARTLIWPAEIYDSTFRPNGFVPGDDGLVFEPPVIDILQCFQPTPSISSQRADKTYYYELVPFGTSDICYFLVPFYGRRAAFVWADHIDPGGGGSVVINAAGVNFRITELPYFEALIDQITLSPLDPIRTIVVRPNYYDVEPAAIVGATQSNGMWDYLMLKVERTADADSAIRIVVSDVNP